MSQHDLIVLLRNELVRSKYFAQSPGKLRHGWVLSHHETYQAA